ncbi:HAAS signaling domain-containing protein [Micromonospora sp. NPDC050417]|uniref:HAAS signaling domain-containing protein n=1 Tax=Micromonospora sp. NPDC050417 TaxID=3364280 RepID=UPI003791596B
MTARDEEGVTQRSEDGMTEREITEYVERVRWALADLPEVDRDELLEDLPEHLAEVAAEGTGALVDRLGTPEAYAAELRAAAGLAAPNQPAKSDNRVASAVRQLRDRLQTVDRRVAPLIGYASVTDLLRLLRPAWWVLRAYLVAMLVTVMTTNGQFGLLPRVDDNDIAGLLLLALCIIGSTWLGRRSDQFRGWRRHLLRLGTVAIVIFGLVGFVDVDKRGRQSGYYEPAYNADPYADVRDVYVYDPQGRLVEGVRLFDQEGRPIRLGYPWCETVDRHLGQPYPELALPDALRQPYPYCPQGAPFRFSTTPPIVRPSDLPLAELSPSGSPTPSGTGVAPGGSPSASAVPTPSVSAR